MKRRRVSLGWPVALAMSLVVACTQERPRAAPEPPPATPSPRPSPGENGLCQPFPDRLIDDFLAAYNGRDLDALTQLVTAAEVHDLVVGAYGGDSSFDDVEEWASAAWAAGDRIKTSGYSPFHPTKNGFQMLVTRSSERLTAEGVGRVSMALNADTDGCAITSLASAGPVQAIDAPCAFYESFGSVPDVAEAEPRVCADGSARFARSAPAAAVVNGRALVWGGARGGFFSHGDIAMDGLLFDAEGRRATRIRPPDIPAFRPDAQAWTGAQLLVVGARTLPDRDKVVVAAYSPETRSWRPIPFPFRRSGGFEGVWTGRELLLWGGPFHSEDPARRGLAYDPLSGKWRKTAPAPGPDAGRWSHSVVWTGSEMIVFGGGNADVELTNTLAYDPETDTWRETAPAPLSSRQWLPLVWTGREVLVWGGSSISRSVADGAAYDPATDSWRKLARSPLHGRHDHSAVWTGTEAVFFGGYDYRRSFADGAAYDPAADRWRRLPKAPVKPRFDHAALWTGDEMLVFGGTWEPGHFSLGDGAVYDPVTNRWRRVVPLLRRE